MAASRPPAPPVQIRNLAESLRRGLPRVVVVRGDERWFRDQALRIAAEAGAAAGLEVVRHDARDPDFDLRGLVDDLTAAPMFSSARCVVVRGAAALVKKEAGEDPPFLRAALLFLGGSSPAGTLVLEADGVRADHALVKRATALSAPVLDLRRLYDQPAPWERNADPRRTELVQWLIGRARERDVALTPDEALYVCTATGNDLFALDGALTRLVGRGRESVRSLVAWESGAAPWDVAEAIARGDAERGLAGIELLLRAGFTGRDGERESDRGALTAILMGSLRGKAREGLLGARAKERGEDPVQAAGIKGPPQAREEFGLRLARRTPEGWERFLEAVAELERASRTGRELDANELAAFALRWRVRARSAGR